MNILLSVHMYLPFHKAGAENYAHNIAKRLVERGFHVRVLMHRYWGSPKDCQMYVLDGVEVFPPSSQETLNELFRWCHVCLSHLDFFKYSVWKCKEMNKPCVFMAHSHSHYYDDIINTNDHVFAIHNAEWIANELPYKRPSMTFEPIVDDTCLAESKGREYITLVNICELKGAELFYRLAELMPDKKFLAVEGSYNEQIVKDLPNVTFWKRTDIKNVFEVTKVLLMPSEEESWGMTAAEALANGIPVICTPTPGLKENCSYAGQYLDRNEPEKWVSLLKKLDNPKEYKKWSEAGLKRTSERPNRIDELVQFLYRAYEYKLQR